MRAALAVVSLLLFTACKRPMAKIEALSTALAKDDASAIATATEGYPACADAPPAALNPTQRSPQEEGCFAAIASALGSKKGYRSSPPDQAAAATVALSLLRDRRGDWIAHADVWLDALKSGTGTGFDALRLAVARNMADGAPSVGRRIDDDASARSAMKTISSAIPGACATYWQIGSGTNPSDLTVEQSAEHSACVHRDLGRREGPGGTYGDGTFRALEGSIALWRETERALRLGVPRTGSRSKAALEAKLAVIERTTQAIATKKLQDRPALVQFLGEAHADAGVVLWRDGGSTPP